MVQLLSLDLRVFTVLNISRCPKFTVMILNFRTDRSGQTLQTQIRLLLEEQSDQGLRCLLFHLDVFLQNTFRFCVFV